MISNTNLSGDTSGMPVSGGMPNMDALVGQMMAMRGMQGGGFPGMIQPPPKEEGVTYLCVTDVQITDRKMGKPLAKPAVNRTQSAADADGGSRPAERPRHS